MNWLNGIKRAAKGLVIVAALVVVAASGFFLVAQTGAGKAWLARLLAATLSHGDEVRVEVGEIEGLIPFDFTIRRLAVADREGPWLVGQNGAFKWAPFALLRGLLHVESVRIGTVLLDRLPQEDEDEERAAGLPSWPSVMTRLQLDRLVIEQLHLGEGLLEEAASFSIRAQVRAPESGGRLATSLVIERTDGPRAKADIEVTLQEKEKVLWLTVDGRIEEDGYGLLAAAMGGKGTVRMTLQGAGPLDNWQGSLAAEAGGLGSLESTLGLMTGEDTRRIVWEGTMTAVEGGIPASLATLIGNVRFSLDGRLGDENRAFVDVLTLKSNGLDVTLSGALDGAEGGRIEGRFTLKCEDLSVLEGLTGAPLAGRVLMEGRFSGPLARPSVTAALTAEEFRFDPVHAGRIAGDLTLECLNALDSPAFAVRLGGSGRVERLAVQTPEWRSEPPFEPRQRAQSPLLLAGSASESRNDTHPYGEDSPMLAVGNLQWTFAAEGPADGKIDVARLAISGEGLKIVLSGTLAGQGAQSSAQVSLDVTDVRRFSDLLGVSVPYGISLVAAMEGDAFVPSVAAQVRGTGTYLGRAADELALVLGREIRYSGRVALDKQRVLNLSDLLIEGLAGHVSGDAALDIGRETLKGSWKIKAPNLARLQKALKSNLEGGIEVNGSVEGPISRPGFAAEFQGTEISVEGIDLGNLSGRLNVEGLPPKFSGTLSAKLFAGTLPVELKTRFSMAGDRLQFPDIALTAKETVVTGGLDVDIARPLVEGAIQGTVKALSAFSPLVKTSPGGRASFLVRFKGTQQGRGSEQGQGIEAEIDGAELTGPLGKVGRLKLRGQVTDAFKSPRAAVQVGMEGIDWGILDVETLALSAEGDVGQIDFSLQAKGNYGQPFDVETSGSLALTSVVKKTRLAKLDGHYGQWPVSLIRPLELEYGVDYGTATAALNIAGGHVEGSGSYEKGAGVAQVDFEGLALSALWFPGLPELSGKAGGRVRVSGPLNVPEATVRLTIQEFGPPAFPLQVQQTDQNQQTGTLTADLTFRESKLQARADISGLSEHPFEITAQIPMTFSLVPPVWGLPDKGAVQGRLTGPVDLAWSSILFGLDDWDFSGTMKVDLMLAGTLADPRIKGTGEIENGSCEGLRTGTVLRNVNGLADLAWPVIKIERLDATDGSTGTISAKGWVDLSPAGDFPHRVDVTLNQATVVRLDSATVAATGAAVLERTAKGFSLTGTLEAGPAEFRIPDRVAPDLGRLEVVELHGDKEGQPGEPTKGPKRGSSLKLDVRATSPGRVFLRGRGLDSEWEGEIRATGTIREPVITGRLSVVRGRFSLLGKRFGLTDGVITFDGSAPPAPYLSIEAEAAAKDVIAILEVKGLASSPSVTLTSVPALPEDEVMARVLFGRSVADVTPIQALQLANAVRTLSGGGGGAFDFMGRTRKLLGVDQLEIGKVDEESGTMGVRAGKYIGERVYFEVQQGLGPESGKASVEVEVAPNISVKSDAGANAEGGAGLNWKLNY